MIEGMADRLALEIQRALYASPLFPYDTITPKDKRRKPHMKDTTMGSFIRISPTMVEFQYGNEAAEKLTPHYHILEDSKIIRNPYQGTEQSRGSQARVRQKGKRDYSVGNYTTNTITVSGQGFSQSVTYQGDFVSEYRSKFTKGRRSYQTQNDRVWIKESNRTTFKTQNKFRYNIHFAYIERILEKHLPNIATMLNLKLLSGRATMIPERMANEPNIKDMVAMFHSVGE